MSLSYELTRALVVASALLAGLCWLVSSHPTTSDPFEVRRTSVIDLEWSTDGETLLSRSIGYPDVGGRLWVHSLGEVPVTRTLPTGSDSVFRAALMWDASAALVLGESGSLERIGLRSRAVSQLLEIPEALEVGALAVSPDGMSFAVAAGCEALLHDVESGRELRRLVGHGAFIKPVIFSGDGRLVATGANDGEIRLWSRQHGDCERVLTGPLASVTKVAFVEGHRRLASITIARDANLCLWDTATGELLWRAAGGNGLLALAISPIGAIAATGGFDREIDLWDLPNRVRCGKLPGHTATIRALCFSPDGATLASAAEDGTVRFWNIPTRTLVRTIDVGSLERGGR